MSSTTNSVSDAAHNPQLNGAIPAPQAPVINADFQKDKRKFESLTGRLHKDIQNTQANTAQKIALYVTLIIPTLLVDLFRAIGYGLYIADGKSFNFVEKVTGLSQKLASPIVAIDSKISKLFPSKVLTQEQRNKRILDQLDKKTKELVESYRDRRRSGVFKTGNFGTDRSVKARKAAKKLAKEIRRLMNEFVIQNSKDTSSIIDKKNEVLEHVFLQIKKAANGENYIKNLIDDSKNTKKLYVQIMEDLGDFNCKVSNHQLVSHYIQLARQEEDVVSALDRGRKEGILKQKDLDNHFPEILQQHSDPTKLVGEAVNKGIITQSKAISILSKPSPKSSRPSEEEDSKEPDSIDASTQTLKYIAEQIADKRMTPDEAKNAIQDLRREVFNRNASKGLDKAEEADKEVVEMAGKILNPQAVKSFAEMAAELGNLNLPIDLLAQAAAIDIVSQSNDDASQKNSPNENLRVNQMGRRLKSSGLLNRNQVSEFASKTKEALPVVRSTLEDQKRRMELIAELDATQKKERDQANAKAAEQAKAEADALAKAAEAEKTALAQKVAGQAELQRRLDGMLNLIFKQQDVQYAHLNHLEKAIKERQDLAAELSELRTTKVSMVIDGKSTTKTLGDAFSDYAKKKFDILNLKISESDRSKRLKDLRSGISQMKDSIDRLEKLDLATDAKQKEIEEIEMDIISAHQHIQMLVSCFQIFEKQNTKQIKELSSYLIKYNHDKKVINKRQKDLKTQVENHRIKIESQVINIDSAEVGALIDGFLIQLEDGVLIKSVPLNLNQLSGAVSEPSVSGGDSTSLASSPSALVNEEDQGSDRFSIASSDLIEDDGRGLGPEPKTSPLSPTSRLVNLYNQPSIKPSIIEVDSDDEMSQDSRMGI